MFLLKHFGIFIANPSAITLFNSPLQVCVEEYALFNDSEISRLLKTYMKKLLLI